MLRSALLLVALAAPASAGSPVGKVVELLGDLKSKVTAEGETAAKEHEEFTEYCRSMKQELEHNIERNHDKIEAASAAQQKAESEIERLNGEISQLTAQSQRDSKDLEGAEKLRKEQNDEFVAGQKDLEDTVDTLVRAVGILRKAGLGLLQAPQAKAVFTQVAGALSTVMDAAVVDSASRKKLQAMLQAAEDGDDDEEEKAFQNPQPKAYESHSKDIIEMIQELKEKAEAELADLRKEEMTRQHEFELLKQSLSDAIKTADRDLKNDQNALAQNQEAAGKASADHSTESNSLSSNEASLKDTVSSCEQRNKDYAAEVVSRNEEITAISKALEILTDPAFASANAARTSFLQLRSKDDVRARAVALLRRASAQFRDVALAQLAIRASEDPFGKVKGLIREMIGRLRKQASEEADHHAYCVSEKKENEAKRDDIQGKYDNFSARLEKAKADESQLKEDVAELSANIAELDSNVAAAQKLRQEESASYAQASQEFHTGLEGLARATQVLKEYYSAGGAHSKATDAGTGIIAMLETAEQDMSNSQAEAEIAEKNAQSDFDKMMQESKVNKATMQATSKAKEGELARLGSAISDLQADVDGSHTELTAVLDYLEKLKGACEHKPQSFADRAAKRQQEIDSLHQALDILENETAQEFMQRS